LRNVAGIVVLTPERLNVGDLVESNFVIFTENALEQARSHFRGELAVGELDETVGIEPADADEGGATDE